MLGFAEAVRARPEREIGTVALLGRAQPREAGLDHVVWPRRSIDPDPSDDACVPGGSDDVEEEPCDKGEHRADYGRNSRIEAGVATDNEQEPEGDQGEWGDHGDEHR